MRLRTGLSWLAFLGTPILVSAAEGVFSVEAAIGTSDNIARTIDDEQSETITSLGTEFGLVHDSRRLNVNLAGDLAWFDYLDDTYDSEIVGAAGASLEVSLIENLLSWSFVDRFGQARRDLLDAPTPGNREYLNQFSTGPDITIPLGETTYVVASSRYMHVNYEDSPFDSQRFVHTAGLRRALSPHSSLTVRASLQSIDPDENPLYEIREAVIAYGATGARTDIGLEAGFSQVKQDGRDDDPDAVVRFSLSRRIGTRSTLALSGSRGVTDSGGSLGGWTGNGLPPTSGSLGLSRTTDPFVATSMRVTWQIGGRVTNLQLSGAWVKEEFDGDVAPDRREHEFALDVSRQISPKVTVGIDAIHSRYRLEGSGSRRESSGSLYLDWQLGRRFWLGMTGEISRDRRSQEAGTSKENRLWMRLRYASDVRPASAR